MTYAYTAFLEPAAVAATAIAAFLATWLVTTAWKHRAKVAALGAGLDPKTYRRAITLFRLGSELVGKIPKREDGVFEILAKLLAMADAMEKTYGGKTTVYSDIFSRYDLREKTSATFIELFMATAVSRGLRLDRIGVSEHLEMIEVVTADGERLFFQEHRYNVPEVSATFFHTPGFNFAAAMTWVWDLFPGGMFLSVKSGRYEKEVTFSKMAPQRDEPISEKGSVRIAAAATAHGTHAGAPYAFIACGAPGTGKTRYVRALAEACALRLLKIDAAALPLLGVQEMGFLVEMLAPGLVLIDDFDRAPIEETRARVLFLFEDLMERRNLVVAVTANDATKLDAAIFRSKRIGNAEAFELPDVEERTDLLGKLGAKHHLSFDIAAVATTTDGFSHDDLSGLMERASREPMPEAIAAMVRLRDLAAKAVGGSNAAKPGDSKPASAPDPS